MLLTSGVLLIKTKISIGRVSVPVTLMCSVMYYYRMFFFSSFLHNSLGTCTSVDLRPHRDPSLPILFVLLLNSPSLVIFIQCMANLDVLFTILIHPSSLLSRPIQDLEKILERLHTIGKADFVSHNFLEYIIDWMVHFECDFTTEIPCHL